MTLKTVRAMLGWCSVINIVVMIWWFLMLVFAHDWAYRMHKKFFKIPVETFNTIQYAGGLFYKVAVFFFNVIPYLALRIVG
jgi:hypothetical protein